MVCTRSHVTTEMPLSQLGGQLGPLAQRVFRLQNSTQSGMKEGGNNIMLLPVDSHPEHPLWTVPDLTDTEGDLVSRELRAPQVAQQS
mmetsp:Transcript_146680/g.256153  ORF Transcript_146680/g.256153 Transcript_146680/m.256153 type:complete len:87 (-) Transcript_146680:970-1230(-)